MASMRQSKRKGSKAERDLIRMFWEAGWAALRSAGSGSMQYPSPDVIAGYANKKFAKKAKVKKLVITHFSQRYKTTKKVLNDAKSIFKNTLASKDFMKI